jgi:hypothetical protein
MLKQRRCRRTTTKLFIYRPVRWPTLTAQARHHPRSLLFALLRRIRLLTLDTVATAAPPSLCGNYISSHSLWQMAVRLPPSSRAYLGHCTEADRSRVIQSIKSELSALRRSCPTTVTSRAISLRFEPIRRPRNTTRKATWSFEDVWRKRRRSYHSPSRP